MGRRIVIWGTGKSGKDFYDCYKDRLNLNVCTDSSEKPIAIEGMEAVNCRELDKDKDFIVICSIYQEEIERRLYIDGWRFGTHYMTSDLFEAKITTEKKLLLTIGRCHIGRISDILKSIPELGQKYTIVNFPQPSVCISEKEFNYAKLVQCIEMLKYADILLCPASVTSNTIRDYAYLEEKLPKKCRVIKVSLPMFGSYWPQDTGKEREVAKWYIQPFQQTLKAYVERDYVIEGLIESGKSKKEIIDIVSDENYFDKETVHANHNKVMQRAYFWDRIADIKIADFLEENYKIKQLYCDRGHLHPNLFKEYIRRILKALDETESFSSLDNEDIWKTLAWWLPSEELIYPSTVKNLGLEFINADSLFRLQLVDGSKLVTFIEGLEMQVEYYMRARSFLETCYLNKRV